MAVRTDVAVRRTGGLNTPRPEALIIVVQLTVRNNNTYYIFIYLLLFYYLVLLFCFLCLVSRFVAEVTTWPRMDMVTPVTWNGVRQLPYGSCGSTSRGLRPP